MYEAKPYFLMALSILGNKLSEGNRMGKASCLLLAVCAGFIIYERMTYRKTLKASALTQKKNDNNGVWELDANL